MKPEVNLAYYSKKDWQKFVASAEDKTSLHDNWKEWHKDFNRTRKRLENEGFVVHAVPVDIDALNQYLSIRGLKNVGSNRSKYVAQLNPPD